MAQAGNFHQGGWAPYGVRGVFNGASLLFFSYVGFDAIATTAEEVRIMALPCIAAPAHGNLLPVSAVP